MDIDMLWKNFLLKMKEQLSSLSYETWFEPTKLHSLHDGVATIIVPTNLHKKHLGENYKDDMEIIFDELTDTHFTFEFKLESEMSDIKKIIDIDSLTTNSGVPKQSVNDANLNPNYTFETFIVGNTNKFAYTAALSVAEKPGKSYNPLFLYGKSGLGKTHLMHAIGNYILKNTNKRVLYVTSEKFVNDFINTVRNKEKNSLELIDNFKSKYRNIDVLLIDDIQFLEGASQTQQEFFHTFNELYNSNKQIIIASDRSIDDLKLLEERLRTRFSWGLTVNIFPPDFELRVDIIRKKIQNKEMLDEVPNEVIEYIASNFDSDIRQLEGAITRVFAFSTMMNGGKITLEVAVDALKEQMGTKSAFKNDIHRIQRTVCDYFQVNLDDLKGKKRTKSIVLPRQIAIYLCRTMTNESFPRIGSCFGGREHSTIIHAVNLIEEDLKTNEQLQTIIKELEKMLSL